MHVYITSNTQYAALPMQHIHMSVKSHSHSHADTEPQMCADIHICASLRSRHGKRHPCCVKLWLCNCTAVKLNGTYIQNQRATNYGHFCEVWVKRALRYQINAIVFIYWTVKWLKIVHRTALYSVISISHEQYIL